ncbi:MAG: hypothetical protein P4L33_21325 [Capsulimonadaceae bacterium]|nr:hypothetical protein [Capsulimonadaceae bacterium]
MFDEEPFYCEQTGLYCQNAAPIDHWDGWLPALEFLGNLVSLKIAGQPHIDIHEFLTRILASAYTVAKSEQEWEGDVRFAGEPGENFYVAYIGRELPEIIDEVYLAWKQDNNGLTYFVGPKKIRGLRHAEGTGEAPLIPG